MFLNTEENQVNDMSWQNREATNDVQFQRFVINRIDTERRYLLAGEFGTRRYGLWIRGQSFRYEMRRNFFMMRVINLFEFSSSKTADAQSLGIFKGETDRFFGHCGIARTRIFSRKTGSSHRFSNDRTVMERLKGHVDHCCSCF